MTEPRAEYDAIDLELRKFLKSGVDLEEIPRAVELGLDTLVFCAHGGRSERLAATLNNKGRKATFIKGRISALLPNLDIGVLYGLPQRAINTIITKLKPYLESVPLVIQERKIYGENEALVADAIRQIVKKNDHAFINQD